jgi:hypothetical protein
LGKSPRAQAVESTSRLVAILVAAGMSQACREKLQPASAGGVEVALPAFAARSEKDDAASGYIERADGRGSRAAIYWDVDPRPGPVAESVARAASGRMQAEAIRTQVAGHEAVLLRDVHGAALVWRCERTGRLFRLVSEGPRAPDAARLATHARCHADRMQTNGDVPAVAMASLGAPFRFANRGRGSISWMNEDEVMTLFAGQALPPPRDADAARQAAPEWVAAAGLSGVRVGAAEPAQGPQGHPGLAVHGAANLDGRAVRWTLLFWRCLQRQKTFAAVIFGAGAQAPDSGPLLAARCHG